jgi:hypothetical protein
MLKLLNEVFSQNWCDVKLALLKFQIKIKDKLIYKFL